MCRRSELCFCHIIVRPRFFSNAFFAGGILMLRDVEEIRKVIEAFFQEKGLKCVVSVADKLSLKVTVEESDGKLHDISVRNKFNDREGNWAQLKTQLESVYRGWAR